MAETKKGTTSLKVVSGNTSFIGRVTDTIKKILVPTRIGMNSFFINLKRNAFMKAYKNLENIKSSNNQNARKDAEEKLKTAYSEYLEAVDKYIMDSIYTKVGMDKASNVEKKALSDYYKISTYKDEFYQQYKCKKQLFILELDYNIQLQTKGKVDPKFQEVYAAKATSIYQKLLKDYAIALADDRQINDLNRNRLYLEVFKTLEKYIEDILPLEIEYSKTNKYNSILPIYDKYKTYTGKLDEKEILEKKLLLLTLSRTLFTYSLPLSVVEDCYYKLLRDTRSLLVDERKSQKKKEKAFEMVKTILIQLNDDVLSTKIYWIDKKDKEQNIEFWEKYNNSKSKAHQDLLICIYELKSLYKDKKIKEKKLRKYYSRKLKSYGHSFVRGYKKLPTAKYIRYVEIEVVPEQA